MSDEEGCVLMVLLYLVVAGVIYGAWTALGIPRCDCDSAFGRLFMAAAWPVTIPGWATWMLMGGGA